MVPGRDRAKGTEVKSAMDGRVQLRKHMYLCAKAKSGSSMLISRRTRTAIVRITIRCELQAFASSARNIKLDEAAARRA